MKKFVFLLFLVNFSIISCGPSAEEIDAQRVQDSIELEADRIKILEKANELLAPEKKEEK
jgi:hypothetical protein